MPIKIAEPKLPRGLLRLGFRLPIWLYRARLGWLLGNRFLMLVHVGRKSGQSRRVVLEVVKHDKSSNTYYVVSGWGEKADWYRNILATPQVVVHVGRRKWDAQAERVSADGGGRVMLDYARRHPIALRELSRIMGYKWDGTQADAAALGRMVPVVALRP